MKRPRLPPSEGANVPFSFRLGEKLLARVEAIAEASGWDKSAVMVHFARWGCENIEAGEQAENSGPGGVCGECGQPRHAEESPMRRTTDAATRRRRASDAKPPKR